jgi:hypothetical protein
MATTAPKPIITTPPTMNGADNDDAWAMNPPAMIPTTFEIPVSQR